MDSTQYDDSPKLKSAFLSYSHVDRPIVSLLAGVLKAAGVRVLWDGAIEAGQLWEDVLLDWLDESDMAFVFWSGNAAKSDWVKTELELLASKRSRLLVPVLLDRTPPPHLLQERQRIEMGDIIERWTAEPPSGHPMGIMRVPVPADEVGASLRRFFIGDTEPELLKELDIFDLGCILSETAGHRDVISAVDSFVSWYKTIRTAGNEK